MTETDTGEIVPRWEWRTFGDDLGTADQQLAGLPAERSEASDELYILSEHGDASVKIRDGLMDVKHLERLSAEHELELWRPVMKAAFPLSNDEAAFVLTTLQGTLPASARAEYSLADFLDELVAPDPALLAAAVHKRRAHYTVDNCMVELTQLRTEDRTTRTLAIESPDPVRVSALIYRFGLGGRRNVNVARGLKALLGFGARRYAVVDVGTNSVKYHLGERRADRTSCTVADRAEITRLGEDLDASGRLADDAIERTVEAVCAMVDDARRDRALEVAAVGTAGLRVASNREEFLDAVLVRCGITVEVISGEEEARLAYLAATSALPRASGRLAVFDSGGGSTQFTFGERNHVEEQFSVNVGAVRVVERYHLDGIVSAEVISAALDAIGADLDVLDARARPDAIVGMGGTATNLAAVKHRLAEYDPEVVHGTTLDVAEVDRQIDLYRTRDVEQRRAIVGLQPARAEVILGGACIVRTILAKLGCESFTVSDRGLRHGLFAERFGS
jgi:exopolyphosphatase/guanosine-5'-triphosphate,3'-diphosphate pyrophosphatase